MKFNQVQSIKLKQFNQQFKHIKINLKLII